MDFFVLSYSLMDNNSWFTLILYGQGGHFSGIYRKVQLKPLKWVTIPRSNGEGEEEKPVEALMVLKYGGVLTHAGRKQVEYDILMLLCSRNGVCLISCF